MPALRSIGTNDYAVIDDDHPVGRIRRAAERNGEVWMWNVTINIPGGVPAGTSESLDQAKADFRTAWSAFKARPIGALEIRRPAQDGGAT